MDRHLFSLSAGKDGASSFFTTPFGTHHSAIPTHMLRPELRPHSRQRTSQQSQIWSHLAAWVNGLLVYRLMALWSGTRRYHRMLPLERVVFADKVWILVDFALI